MKRVNLQPIKGFRDLYPQDKVVQDYVFDKLKEVASSYGFENYDGPLLEPIELYTGKTSEELINKQSYILKDKNDNTLLLRPEMTPTLARMIAARANELVLPIKLFNLGLRFRYEAPQKSRSREFYQADFDILGSDNVLADAEIINTAVSILTSFGATEKDFVVYINSRRFMEEELLSAGFSKEQVPLVLFVLDKMDKITDKELDNLTKKLRLDKDLIVKLANSEIKPDTKYFKELFDILEELGIKKYCAPSLSVVRGLDYYTGIVFEAKKSDATGRSTIIGGGRYDNLISALNPQLKISGVGFAVSDVVLMEFLRDISKLPNLKSKATICLVTVFSKELLSQSIKLTQELRFNNIKTEIYPDYEKKLDKQLKYADKNKIPFVAVVGPEEVKKGNVTLKIMESGEQKLFTIEELVKFLSSYGN